MIIGWCEKERQGVGSVTQVTSGELRGVPRPLVAALRLGRAWRRAPARGCRAVERALPSRQLAADTTDPAAADPPAADAAAAMSRRWCPSEVTFDLAAE